MQTDSQPKIWDAFLYSGETEVLRTRLKLLNDFCDYFVIVESAYSFSGQSRNISDMKFRNAVEREYLGKIKWIIIQNFDESLTAWEREAWQRNQVKFGLEGIEINDVIFLSDVDEIPNQRFLGHARNIQEGEVLVAKMKQHYYESDFDSIEDWYGTIATKWKENLDFQELRIRAISHWNLSNLEIVIDAGNHYSSMGDSKYLSQKIQSFSHTEFNVFPFNNSSFLSILIFLGIKFDGSEVFKLSSKLDTSVYFLCSRRHRQDGIRKKVASVLQPLVAKLYRMRVGSLSSPVNG
jgi:beta-1,4-mannosyl-glycoprotein beta-1,4-N-acetylglucosaminyltransferase